MSNTTSAAQRARHTGISVKDLCRRGHHTDCALESCSCECHTDPDYWRRRSSAMNRPPRAIERPTGMTTTSTIEWGVPVPKRGNRAEWVDLLELLDEVKERPGEPALLRRFPKKTAGNAARTKLREFAQLFGTLDEWEFVAGQLDRGGSGVWALFLGSPAE